MEFHPLQFLRELKSVSVASSAGNKPYSRIIDVMLHEGEKLYFVTARGKHFYKQLKDNPFIAVTGMSNSYVTVRASGPIEFIGEEYRERIFNENRVLSEIYPRETSEILEVFCMTKCRGEVFDLSTNQPKRERFSYGYDTEPDPAGYFITDECTVCGACIDTCPTSAISVGDIYVIDGSLCLECGRCAEVCSFDAIQTPQEF